MKFKVGDMVIVKDRRYGDWNSHPMEITNIWPSGSYSCIHPIYGNGGFQHEDLIHSHKHKNIQTIKTFLEIDE